MGIIRLTLFSAAALAAAMVWYGRDDGLPQTRIGRAPNPDGLHAVKPVSSVNTRAAVETVEAVGRDPLPADTPPSTPVETGSGTQVGTQVETGPETRTGVRDTAAIPASMTIPTPATAVPARRPEARPATGPAQIPQIDPVAAAVNEALAAPETVATATAPATAPVMLYVSGTQVNLRTGPATSFAKVGTVTRGQALIDMGDAGDGWRMVGLPAGATGYMSADFLSPTPQ